MTIGELRGEIEETRFTSIELGVCLLVGIQTYVDMFRIHILLKNVSR